MNETDGSIQKYRNDLRPTEELFRMALEKDADADDLEYWNLIRVLQHRLPQVLHQVELWSTSENAKTREVAATILGQNRVEDKVAVDQCIKRLVEMLEKETSSQVTTDIIFALGQHHHHRSIEALLKFKTHPDPDVRYAVVHGLLGHEDNRAINALIDLSADHEEGVRNWATFGLGSQIETNSQEIRDALALRLQETDAVIRGEAMVGLARRCDLRVAEPLLRELDDQPPEVIRDWLLMEEAAEWAIQCAVETRNPGWVPVLEKLKFLEIGDREKIDYALASYPPCP